VNQALRSAIEAMSLDGRLELGEYIESTVESQLPIEATDDHKAVTRSRALEPPHPAVGQQA
jgi:hypothetical protein